MRSLYSIVIAGFLVVQLAVAAGAQEGGAVPDASRQQQEGQGETVAATPPQSPNAGTGGTPPTGRQLGREFVMQTLGPYSILMAGFTAGIHQGTDSPPDWHQGAGALGKRFGSNMGITAVGNATRLGLAAALGQDTSYHRCACKGWMPRLRHAGVSALVARRRRDGHAVFSVPGLVAPYAATMTATYAWYPERYGAKDAFRMGNYNLLGTVGTDIAFEFVPKVVWRVLGRVHLNSRRMQD